MKYLILLMLFPFMAYSQDFRILTWNVFMLPKPIKFSYQAERTEFIIKLLKSENYDIVLLQEAFSDDFRKKIKKALLSKYPHQNYLGRNPGSLTVYGSGAYILSRYPLSQIQHAYYSDCAKSDCFASKGVSLVTLTTEKGRMIQIANTHLQSGKDRGAIRFKQLDQIKRLMDTFRAKEIPQILVGDLNIDALSGNDYQKALDFLKMKSSPLEGEPQYTNGFPIECYKKPGDDQKEWLDHIFVSQDFTGTIKNKRARVFKAVLEGKECPLSDHHGVEAFLSI